MPLFLSVFAHYFIPGERLTTRKIIGILCGTLGLFLAMNIHFGGGIWAAILALTSALAFFYLYNALERFEVLFVDIFIIIVYCIIKSVKAGAG